MVMECPREPEESECCNSGCNPCIFDVYQEQLKKYKKWQENEFTIVPSCLKPLTYIPFTLVNIIEQGNCCNIYVFEYDGEDAQVAYEAGQHLLIKMKSEYDKTEFTRAYTPIPWQDLNKNQFATLIKLYPNGEMSNSIKRLEIGCTTLWRGPYGDYQLNYKENGILMIAQGTGIAPIYAIIKKILDNDECDTWLKLFYCCKDKESIYLRDELHRCKNHWNFDYELFVGQSTDDDYFNNKYNEVCHEKKLSEEDIKHVFDKEWTSILICGSQTFGASMESTIEKYTNVPIHLF